MGMVSGTVTELLTYRRVAEGLVQTEPLLMRLGELASNPAVYNLTWMISDIDSVLASKPVGLSSVRWCQLAITDDPGKRQPEESMPQMVMAVVGHKPQPHSLELNFMLTKPESWTHYLAEISREQAA